MVCLENKNKIYFRRTDLICTEHVFEDNCSYIQKYLTAMTTLAVP